MKLNSNVLKSPVKDVKKAMYRGKITKFKRIVKWMILGGILASIAFGLYYAYVNYAVSEAHIVLSYPKIAQAQYPDGSRFTYYDFICDERIEEALEKMQENGKYKDFTVDDIRNNLKVTGYLNTSASTNVSTERSEGNDFSYVANEYRITYTQPHNYKNLDIRGELKATDDSKEFLKALVLANKKNIAKSKGGIDGFEVITLLDDTTNYDFDEKVAMYKTKKNAIVTYLTSLDKKAPKFKSQSTNMSIKDVKNKYEYLITNKLDAISNYLDTTGISKNVEVATNKVKVNIENNKTKYDKFADEAAITEYAMKNYDHTFTENLINVVRDDSQGLYQARPKTAFDEVVVRMNNAKENVSQYNEYLFELNNDLNRYYNIDQSVDKTAVMTKCDKLFSELDAEYNGFTKEAYDTVSECYDEINKDFISGTVMRNNILSISLAVKLAIAFAFGMILMFLAWVYFSILGDKIALRRRHKLLNKIKKASKGA